MCSKTTILVNFDNNSITDRILLKILHNTKKSNSDINKQEILKTLAFNFVLQEMLTFGDAFDSNIYKNMEIVEDLEEKE